MYSRIHEYMLLQKTTAVAVVWNKMLFFKLLKHVY